MIAFITSNADAVAETYIRNHIFGLFPRQSVLIYESGDAIYYSQIPRLIVNYNSTFLKRLYRLVAFTRTFSFLVPVLEDKRNIEEFLLLHNVKIVYAEFGNNGIWIAPICKSLNIPLVVNFHGYDATVLSKRWDIRLAYKILSKRVELLVCGSNYFTEVVKKIGFATNEFLVSPCGVNIALFDKPNNRSGKILIAVGRLVEKKAPDLLIRAFKEVNNKYPDVKLEIIGGGSYSGKLERLIQDMGLEQHVKLWGAQSHDFVVERLSEADIFLQHSVTASNGDMESQGISLIEAMASYLPVVTTDHNGFKETVQHGINGYLVQEYDYLSMADRVIELLENNILRNDFGQKSREIVEKKFDLEKINSRLKNKLIEIIENH